MAEESQWKARAMLVGGVVGALLGVGTAYLLAQRAEREGRQLEIGPGEGLRLGVLLLGMLRQVAGLGEGPKHG
jgi:gas vesicle protein